MALSMDEQRMLAEIERRLAAADPGLASNLATFRKPGRLSAFRSTRARVIGSLFTVAVVAMASLMVYAMLPFRSGGRTPSHTAVITSSGPGQAGTAQAKIGAAPAKVRASAAAKSSSSAQPSARTGQTAGASRGPSARASASSPHASGAPAPARSASSASAAVHGP